MNQCALSMKSPGPSVVGGATADLEAPKAVIVNNDNEVSSIDWSDDEEDTNPSAAKLLEAERMRVARADWKRRRTEAERRAAAAREAVERTPAPRRARPPERKRKSVTASAARKRQRDAEEDAALRRLQPIAARIAAEVPPAPPTRDPSFYKNAPDAEFWAWFGLRDTAPSPADQNALIPSY